MRPIRYGDKRVLLTTASDTDTLLSSISGKRHFVFVGSGVQQWYNLGDARRMGVGTPFIFENYSSELVGVRSNGATIAASTLWMKVPPYGTLVCTLRDNSTAEGVWFSNMQPNQLGNFGNFEHYDLLGVPASNTSHGPNGPYGVVSGGTIAPYASFVTGRQGIYKMEVSTVGNWAVLYNSRYAALGGGARFVEYCMSRSNANAAANEFTTRAGLSDTVVGGVITNGAYFINAFTTYGGNFWVTVTISAATGASTTNVSAIAPRVTPNYDLLRVEVASSIGPMIGAGRVDFILNKALIATHTTDIPSGGLANVVEVDKVADALARSLLVDDWTNGAFSTTPRY